jgi:hypothetical protein
LSSLVLWAAWCWWWGWWWWAAAWWWETPSTPWTPSVNYTTKTSQLLDWEVGNLDYTVTCWNTIVEEWVTDSEWYFTAAWNEDEDDTCVTRFYLWWEKWNLDATALFVWDILYNEIPEWPNNEIPEWPTFVNDLFNIDRSNVDHPTVKTALQALQSFDLDWDTSNGITIKNNISIPSSIPKNLESLNTTQLNTLVVQNGETLVSESDAIEHYLDTLFDAMDSGKVERIDIEPVITSEAPSIWTISTLYSWTPTEPRKHTWDVITYTSNTLPSWSSFDTNTWQVSFTPTEPWTYTFSITAHNWTNTSEPFSWTVEVPDPIPTATTSSISVTEDTPESWNLEWSDPEGDSLTYHKVSDPSKWTLSINSDWSYTYTPNANEFWTDSFQYKVNDWTQDSVVKIVTVNISWVNDAPNAATSSISVTEDVAKSWHLSWSDIENNSLTYHKVSDPSNWTLSINSDWSYTYTPNANFNWTDSFQYKVNDWTSDSSTQTVTVNVWAENDTPTATTSSISVTEDTPESWNLEWSDPEGDSLTYHKVSDPSKWTLSINSDWSYTYTPNANEFWTDSFQYKVNDWSADSTVQTVTVNIDAVNDVHSISSPTLDSKTDTTINTVPWDFTDSDWVQNKTVKLYSDSWLTTLVGTNANWDFTWLSASTTYYVVTTWEAYNAETSAWETKVSTKLSVTTNAELDTTPDSFEFNQWYTISGIPVDLNNVNRGIRIESNEVTISWINAPTDISIDYWDYKIKRHWTDTRTTWYQSEENWTIKVNNWDKIIVSHETSPSYNNSAHSTITIW